MLRFFILFFRCYSVVNRRKGEEKAQLLMSYYNSMKVPKSQVFKHDTVAQVSHGILICLYIMPNLYLDCMLKYLYDALVFNYS
jgi:hypothetical protein